MPWVRLDDGLHHNVKLAGLTSNAFRLWVHSLTFSAEKLTDGHISPAELPLVWPHASSRTLNKAVDELVHSGCWDSNGNGWVVPDFLEFNPSADEVRARREVRARAGQRGGLATAVANAKQTLDQPPSKRIAKSYPVPVPVPRSDLPLSDITEAALDTWARMEHTEATPKWLNQRRSHAWAFMKQHPNLNLDQTITFLRWARQNGCQQVQGWDKWWPGYPDATPKKVIKDCEICDNRRLIETGENEMTPCKCVR